MIAPTQPRLPTLNTPITIEIIPSTSEAIPISFFLRIKYQPVGYVTIISKTIRRIKKYLVIRLILFIFKLKDPVLLLRRLFPFDLIRHRLIHFLALQKRHPLMVLPQI